MTFCPFQRPEPLSKIIGGATVELLKFSQHPEFVYQRTVGGIESSVGFGSWYDTAFSNLLYIERGCMKIQAPDQGVVRASSGEWLFVSALQQPLQVEISSDCSFHWIECDASVWKALSIDGDGESVFHHQYACIACEKRNEAMLIRGDQSTKMRLHLLELSKNDGENAVERLKIASLSYELLSITLESKEFSVTPASEPCYRSVDLDALDAAARYLENNLDADHSIQKLSRQFYINEFKLKKGFKDRFNKTVFGYLRHKRMDYAKRLLTSTETSVLEVATRVGYSNPSHFSRAFREAHGVNPGELKRN